MKWVFLLFNCFDVGSIQFFFFFPSLRADLGSLRPGSAAASHPAATSTGRPPYPRRTGASDKKRFAYADVAKCKIVHNKENVNLKG